MMLRLLCLGGKFEEAAQMYAAHVDPTPEEDYWGAYAFGALQDSTQAFRLFERAWNRGYRQAAAPFANYLIWNGEIERAQVVMTSLDPREVVEPWHRGWICRERGRLLELEGQYSAALLEYQQAWEAFCTAPGKHLVLAGIGQQFAWLLGLHGQTRKALEVTREALRYAGGYARAYLMFFCFWQSCAQANFVQAYEALAELKELSGAGEFRELERIASGTLAQFEGRWQEAIDCFKDVVIAESVQAEQLPNALSSEGQVLGSIMLAVCLFATGDAKAAEHLLERVEPEIDALEPFISSVDALRLRASLIFRRGVLKAAVGQMDQDALDLFERARRLLVHCGLRADAGLILLHLADAYLRWGKTDAAIAALQEARTCIGAAQDRGHVLFEMRLLPQLEEFAATVPLPQNHARSGGRLIAQVIGRFSLETLGSLRRHPRLRNCEVWVVRPRMLRISVAIEPGTSYARAMKQLDTVCDAIEEHNVEVEEAHWERNMSEHGRSSKGSSAMDLVNQSGV